jgi:hypothetical protein
MAIPPNSADVDKPVDEERGQLAFDLPSASELVVLTFSGAPINQLIELMMLVIVDKRR